MELTLNCPKCKAHMEQGFVVDYGQGGMSKVSVWAAGVPESSFWSGLKVESTRQICTYRCTGCGYLESYANQAPK